MAETTQAKEQGDRAEARGRRLARFSITPEVFVWMGRGQFEVISNPLPLDSSLVGAFYDESRHQFTVIVESDSFAPVADGEAVPEVQAPSVRRILL